MRGSKRARNVGSSTESMVIVSWLYVAYDTDDYILGSGLQYHWSIRYFRP